MSAEQVKGKDDWEDVTGLIAVDRVTSCQVTAPLTMCAGVGHYVTSVGTWQQHAA